VGKKEVGQGRQQERNSEKPETECDRQTWTEAKRIQGQAENATEEKVGNESIQTGREGKKTCRRCYKSPRIGTGTVKKGKKVTHRAKPRVGGTEESVTTSQSSKRLEKEEGKKMKGLIGPAKAIATHV